MISYVRISTPDSSAISLTAGFPLVPPGRQQQYSRLAKRMGKAFRACGFETPYGWWIPDAYLERLEAMVAEIVARLPSPTKLVTEVKAYIAKHKEDLEETTDAIVQLATDHGIQHPSMWTDARDEALASLKSRYRESPVESWPSSTGHAEAIKYIRSSPSCLFRQDCCRATTPPPATARRMCASMASLN